MKRPVSLLLLLLVCTNAHDSPVVHLKSPPMGFMSWERFRCQVDCQQYPNECINEQLYVDMADQLVLGGYAQAGYTQVSIDDCWTDKDARRDPNGELMTDPSRFPRGIPWLATFMHSQGLLLGIYADAGMETCGHYEGSQGKELQDATTFSNWGIDYLKLDGCHIDAANKTKEEAYAAVYTEWGKALHQVDRPMVFSCSWPAYIGTNESAKPYDTMYRKAGCNTWRNYKDVENKWDRLSDIVLHWADYWRELQAVPQGAFNDADMLLAGDDHYGTVLPLEQARLQMGFWAMIASPLFIGGNLRTIPEDYRAILLNEPVIAINQDRSSQQADCVIGCVGTRDAKTQYVLEKSVEQQIWSKSIEQQHKSRALLFMNLNQNGNATLAYLYKAEGAIARCVDLWGTNPDQDVCDQGRGGITPNWTIVALELDGHVWLEIKAFQVAPTSQRFLRIDFFCDHDCEEDKRRSSTTLA